MDKNQLVGSVKVRFRQLYSAWVYAPKISIPIWVARHCHDLGDGLLHPGGKSKFERGDVITRLQAIDNEGQEQEVLSILSWDYFIEEFEIVPEN